MCGERFFLRFSVLFIRFRIMFYDSIFNSFITHSWHSTTVIRSVDYLRLDKKIIRLFIWPQHLFRFSFHFINSDRNYDSFECSQINYTLFGLKCEMFVFCIFIFFTKGIYLYAVIFSFSFSLDLTKKKRKSKERQQNRFYLCVKWNISINWWFMREKKLRFFYE